MCVCVCVCVCWGVPIPDPYLLSHQKVVKLSHSLAPWTNGRTPPWQLKPWITILYLVFPSPHKAFSIRSSELGQVITHLGVYSTRIFRLPGLHPVWTRSCHIPAVTISLVNNESMPKPWANSTLLLVFFKCFLYIKNNSGSPFFLLKYPF